ncbi:MAG: xylose isomerase [Paenibacillaceae bacterium]|jgi:sugar phosphate isomerase/epimerase|nr:xylose isomerase [Paenibacillaceae bacterium]
MERKTAVQLYTVREECQTDFPYVLRQLKQMGWGGVQFAGYHGMDPQELAAILKELGLQTAGLHVGYKRFLEEPDKLIQEARILNTRDLVCSSTPADLRTPEGYAEVRRALNEAAVRLKREDMRLSYHNHAFELETMVEGRTALDYLLEPTRDNLVLAELDVYWVKKGGYDPLSYIAPYKQRMPIIHLKDMSRDGEETFAEVGEGSINFKPILEWGEANGVEWYVVEQDSCKRSPMDCVETSRNNLFRYIEELR